MFVKITNGQVEKAPYTIGEFRKSKPNVSMPKDIPTAFLEANGVFTVQETSRPSADTNTHSLSWAVELVNGKWTQVWSSVQKDEGTAAKNIRDERNARLSDSDWTQGKDIPEEVATPWATYRQALRDLPSQDGFPFSVVWPVKPT